MMDKQAKSLALAVKRGRPLDSDGELPIPYFSYVQAALWFADFFLSKEKTDGGGPRSGDGTAVQGEVLELQTGVPDE